MSCFRNAPPVNIGKDPIDLSKDVHMRSGLVRFRGLGRISNRLWKKRQLILVENELLIQYPQQHSLLQRPLKRIPLQSIINLERIDLTPACLLLELSSGRKCYLAFDNDAALYDWQDDIYPRSRLGNFSRPFNFVHEVHLTSNDFLYNTNRMSALRNRMGHSKRKPPSVTSHRTSSEVTHKQTYRQLFFPQRASCDSYTKKSIGSHKRTNSASSSSTCRFVSDSSIHPTGSLANSPPSILLEGLYQVKCYGRRSLLNYWRPRYVVITSRTLQICRTQSSSPEVTIPLPHITDLSQLKFNSKPFVLRLATRDNRRYQISLPNTSDLQKWYHCIGLRSRRAHISEPDGFEFHVHVSWDSKSQAFTGLPDEWKASLEMQEVEANTREPPSNTSSPAAQFMEPSPTKPMGPRCPMCYTDAQCSTCKLDASFTSNSSYGAPKLSTRSHSQRNRPFSLQSGTTLIGDHENHRYY